MRALVTFTVAESKKLIAKAVVRHPIVARALADHTIILGGGTTNAFVYTEMTGKPMDPGSFAVGIICPEGPCVSGVPRKAKASGYIIFIKGIEQQNTDIEDILTGLGAEDVFIKGANALDPEGRVGVIVGHAECGHGGVGRLWTRTVSQGIPVVMPVGLEKRIPCSIYEASSKVGIKTVQYSTGEHFGLFIPHGNVIVLTEIEAIRDLTGAKATVVSAGGVNGAEGALVFSIEGTKEQIDKMIQLVDEVKGVPPIEVPRGVCIPTPGYTGCYASQCFWKRVANSKRPAWKRRKELEIHDSKLKGEK
jgi:hypothetical protein